MSGIINFNKARKQRDRKAAEAQAAENRVRFGRTKEQKVLEAAQAAEAQRRLDQLRRDPGDAAEPQGGSDDAAS